MSRGAEISTLKGLDLGPVNAALGAAVAKMYVGAFIEFFDGYPPEHPEDPAGRSPIVRIPIFAPDSWADGSAQGDPAAMYATGGMNPATRAGTISWYRIVTADGQPLGDGTVGHTGSDTGFTMEHLAWLPGEYLDCRGMTIFYNQISTVDFLWGPDRKRAA